MKQEIIYKSVKELVPYAMNSRTHSDEQVAQIMASIKEFEFTNPILTDGDNGVIAGHGRLMAAQRLGIEEVPTIELSHLTETQKKAYIIADNKLALNSGWDEEMLAIELQDLHELGYDMDLTGFENDEIDSILNNEDEIDFDSLSISDESINGVDNNEKEQKKAIVVDFPLYEYENYYEKIMNAKKNTDLWRIFVKGLEEENEED